MMFDAISTSLAYPAAAVLAGGVGLGWAVATLRLDHQLRVARAEAQTQREDSDALVTQLREMRQLLAERDAEQQRVLRKYRRHNAYLRLNLLLATPLFRSTKTRGTAPSVPDAKASEKKGAGGKGQAPGKQAAEACDDCRECHFRGLCALLGVQPDSAAPTQS